MRRIALLTDFGTRDPYVAAMKGVLAARTTAPVFDLSHEIAPFDALEAGWFLRAAAPYWPSETVFVAVVDPGVGTPRRILALESAGQLLLAPDNGLLTFFRGDAYSVENEALFLATGSTTFHGRDRFAPVAAAIANGLDLRELGPRVFDRVCLELAEPDYRCDTVTGAIVHIDRFGNAVTNVEADKIVFPRFALRAGTATVARMSKTYEGEGAFLVVGSTGMIEISMAQASAAELLHLRRGDRVTIVPT